MAFNGGGAAEGEPSGGGREVRWAEAVLVNAAVNPLPGTGEREQRGSCYRVFAFPPDAVCYSVCLAYY